MITDEQLSKIAVAKAKRFAESYDGTYFAAAERYFNDMYDGNVPRPCDDDCPENCRGGHLYEFTTEYKPIFDEELR